MKRSAAIAAVLFALAVPLFASYIVVLKDGTQYKAKQKWTVSNGKALVALTDGGMLQIDPSLIDTKKTDRLTFAIGCGIAGVAGAAFTTIGSTGPTSGSLYIVDAFLVVTFGGAASLLGTVVSAFGIAQTQSITEFFLAGSMAKVLTLSLIVVILMMRTQHNLILAYGIPIPETMLHKKKVPYGIAIGAAAFLAYPMSPIVKLALAL